MFESCLRNYLKQSKKRAAFFHAKPPFCADPIRTMCRCAPHHAPTRSASCADTLRIMRRHAPHDVPTQSAQYAHQTRPIKGGN